MLTKKTLAVAALAVAALAAAPALANQAVNVYWGQAKGTDRLASYCDSTGIDYITLAFVNQSPQQDKSGLGYPGFSFSTCLGDVYTSPSGKDTNLLDHCGMVAEDVRYCRSKGKKVLLSIGGVFTNKTDYTVSSDAEGVQFAEFLWGAFGPYNATAGVPRPLDDSYRGTGPADKYFAVDGFDFDIEQKFGRPALAYSCPAKT
jgi:chitinase